MGLSVWQLLIVALVILVLFGRGRISEMMGDFGKGIKSFKHGMNEEDEPKPAPRIEGPSNDPAKAETRDTTSTPGSGDTPR
jgi:sec-independent protein translocase protein TatA